MKLRIPIISLILLLILISCEAESLENETQNVVQGLIVYGDTRTNHKDHQRVVNAILKAGPEVVFHTGDMVANGRHQAQWDTFNAITSKLRETSEFFPVLGNHENNSDLYFDNFELPNNERWYSVNRGGVHFIILDSCSGIDTVSAQYSWLKLDLEEAKKSFSFIVALFHHPPFSTGPHTEDEKGLRDTIVPLFESYDVDVVFSGHDHDYERSLYNGIYYIVSGGGGAPLYDQERKSEYSQVFRKVYHFCELSVTSDSLTVCVFDTLSNMIDRFSVPAE
ncbi:metallophosphoesterase [bacterium]|nr:metallophosphoesterase [bacterium]